MQDLIAIPGLSNTLPLQYPSVIFYNSSCVYNELFRSHESFSEVGKGVIDSSIAGRDMMMDMLGTPINRRNFLRGSSQALAAVGAFTAGCNRRESNPEGASQGARAFTSDPASWWSKEGFFVHEAVDAGRLSEGLIKARIEGTWLEFRVAELPDRFVDWSLQQRVARLGRMVKAGGMDPRDLAGSHNACVATYGGPSRDSAVSLNTAYKGMGFTVHARILAETTQRIVEEKMRIERDFRSTPFRMMQEKVLFLARFYQDQASFDRTKQVSLELFTEPDFHTHTFLNMMVNPIASASFLAFPTFEIRAVPQLFHPRNPGLSQHEKDLVAYTNAIHDFIHSGPGERIACVYHVIELFEDTPNDMAKGRRIVP